MKSKFIVLAIVVAILSACSSTQHTAYYQDDIYYNPKDKPVSVSDKYTPVAMDKTQQKQENKTYSQLQREYEKTDAAKQDDRDFTEVQEDYLALLKQDSISELDTLVYFNDETGYWVDGFQGSNMDQDYAERLIKFHGPFNGIPYWSPIYNDVVYFNNYDWNVYVDGDYAYAFPTWSNPWYNNYRYNYGYRNPWRWGFSMSWGYGYPYYGHGWYDPWCGWYDPWCSPFYGGGYAYGYHHGWNDGYWHGSGGHYPGGSYAGSVTRPRYSTASSVRGSSTSVSSGPRSTRINSSTTNRYSTTPTRVTSDNKVIIQGNTRNYTRVSRTQYDQSLKTDNKTTGTRDANSSTVRTTRGSYTPSYSRTSGTTRSSYNRKSTYTRSSTSTTRTSNNRRTYSSSSSNNRQNSNTYNSNNRSYSSGSTSRSSNSYSPSRSSSSSSRSSYTPSRSSSSGSSYSPSRSSSSGSSSRSSGGSSTRSSSGGSTRTTRSR